MKRLLRIDPRAADYRNIYKLLTGVVVPRPIAFVSTLSCDGIPNLAPFSYFTVCSANPPCVLFSPSSRGADGAEKDTLVNARETGEFVINIVSEHFAAQMNATSAEFPPEIDEFTVSGLQSIPSEMVKPGRVAESSVHMECKVRQIIAVSEEAGGGTIVIGEVLLFHLSEEILADPEHDMFKIDPSRLHAIGRMGGPTYVRTQDRFDLDRPDR
jgi:flavin reductase (DIM6/NTAB) family NADH-FMN oxidoreductase RutF